MPDAFKNKLNPELIASMAGHLQRAAPDFDATRFQLLAVHGLDALELKQRVVHIRTALAACLPADFDQAAAIIEASLMPVSTSPTPWQLNDAGSGISGWAVWPLTDHIAHAGLAHPQRALQALHALTQRFTAEFSIRPFLQQHPQLTLATLAGWVHDDSEHVRRLVSEGSRPRLPWGMRLQAFVQDPSPCLPLLQVLKGDSSEYVRRSVANHLNDISKDHADLAVAIARQWLDDADANTAKLVRHALRSLIKQGHGGALALLGFEHNAAIHLQKLRLTSSLVPDGGQLHFQAEVVNPGPGMARLCIDYAIHHRKANGTQRAKVFKLLTASVAEGASVQLDRRHSFRAISTRTYHAGEHALEILVNGRSLGRINFELLADGCKSP